jgi:hypothetical protein
VPEVSQHPEKLLRKVLVTVDRICSRREDAKPSLLEPTQKARARRGGGLAGGAPRASQPRSVAGGECAPYSPSPTIPPAHAHTHTHTHTHPTRTPRPQAYASFRDSVVRLEREVLKAFGFITHVHHPHKQMLNYCQVIRADQAHPALMQEAWNVVNDRRVA